MSGGAITVDRATTTLEIGLAYDLEIVTMPVAVEDDKGLGVLEVKRIGQVEMRVLPSTRSIYVNGDPISDRTFGEKVFGLQPFEGTPIRRISLLGYGRDEFVTITQTAPFPFLLLAITLQIDI